jgi:flagellar protein FliS
MENVSNQYLRNAVLTAPPEQLLLMLYEGAVRFTRQGIRGIEEKNWEDAFNGFSKAQKILLEMLNSLNYEVDRALCTRMAGLYTFIYQKLVDASIQRDVKLGKDALGLLEYQRETWLLLIDKLRQDRPPSTNPIAIEQDADASLDKSYGALSVQG